MSELDFLLNRKKSVESAEEKREEKKEESQNSIEKREEKEKDTLEPIVNTEEKKEDVRKEVEEYRNTIEESMEKFLDKDPKIGVWSYPAFLVLQYLYSTKPGFKMSKIAKEALELGMKQIYPDLFRIAEKVSEKKKK